MRRSLEIDEIQKPKNQTQQLVVEYLYLPEGCDDIDAREDKHNLGKCLAYVIYSILDFCFVVWDDRDEHLSDPYNKKKIAEKKAAKHIHRRRAKSQAINLILMSSFRSYLINRSWETSS